MNTLYIQNKNAVIKNVNNNTENKLREFRPLYFDRFRYVGKGFKLIYKKRKNMLNCVFGYSHLLWIKTQKTFLRRTKKYKLMFVTKTQQSYLKTINILLKIKPINRYTLRGLRTYTHVWIKRKGRKSTATHF